MRVREYLSFVAELKGVEKAALSKRVDYAIEKTQLGQVQKRLIGNLSKGFRQRVGIAGALVSDPQVLILDEPTVGLDPKQVAEIRQLIQELRGQHTIILSTHILPEVEATCERVIIINKGKIVAEDRLENLTRLKSQGVEKVIVRVRKPDQAMGLWSEFDSQMKVQKGRVTDEFELELLQAEKRLDDLAQFILSKGLGILELRMAQANLEDVFLNLTYGSTFQTSSTPNTGAHQEVHV